MAKTSITPDRLWLRIILVDDDSGTKIVDEESSIVHLSKRGDATDIDLSSGKSLHWTKKSGWVCWNDYDRRQQFPYEAHVFMN